MRPIKYLLPLFLISLLLITASCMSVPDPEEIPGDLHPRQYFQFAQNAVVDRSNYRAALVYYETFIERHPDLRDKVVEAEYEIAFIHYKREDYFKSEKLFKELLAKYETDDAIYYPYWPKILSEKILDKIGERKPF